MQVYNPTGLIYDGPEELYPPYIEEAKKLLDPTIKTWRMDVRGYYNRKFADYLLERSFADTVYGDGLVIFTGTFKQASEIEDELHKNNIKVIGVKPYNP